MNNTVGIIIICLIVFVVCVWLYTRWHIRQSSLRLTAANESLSVSLVKYEAILDSMMSGVVCYDSDGVMIDINEKALQLYGTTDTKAEFLARRLSCDVNPNLKHFDMGYILRGNSFDGVIEYDFDSINQTGFYHTTHNGKRLHEVKISPLFNTDKRFKGFIILLNDITEFSRNQKELEENRRKVEEANLMLSGILSQTPCAMFIKDVEDDYRYIVANKMFSDYQMKKESDIVGKTDYDLFSFRDADKFRHDDEASVANNATYSFAEDVIWNDRHITWYTTKAVIITPNGKKLLVGVCQDITEKERNRIELLQAKESDKLKSAFLANMSHEIRTPLNAIVGFSALLSEAEYEEEKIEFSHIIQTNSDLLLRLIGDILDLSKVESGMVDFKTERFDMVPYFNELGKSLKQRVTHPGVRFIVDNPYSRCMIEFDKGRMAQIITNYATNAFKFTADGYVKMGYACVDGGIRIYVTDTGTGIPKEKQSKVFQRFEKLNEFAQGTGLGLSICKAITEACGGHVGFESEEGAGSTFWAWNACGEIDCR